MLYPAFFSISYSALPNSSRSKVLHFCSVLNYTKSLSNLAAEKEGRSSGSLEWRLSRGETRVGESAAFIFHLSSKEEERKEFIVKYSSAQDQYVRLNAEEPIPKGWQSGVKAAKNIFRKHETDWKMVYLSRTGMFFSRLCWLICFGVMYCGCWF